MDVTTSQKLAVVYCRVSGKVQAKDDRFSLSDQEESGLTVLKQAGYKNIVVLKDVHTGDSSLSEREEGKKLSEYLNNGMVEAVAVKHDDRLFRNTAKALTFIDELKNKDIKLFINGNPINLISSESKLLFGITALIAENEKLNIRRRTITAVQRRKENGEFFHSQTFGYDRKYDSKGKAYLEVNPVESNVIWTVFSKRLNGESVNQIVKYLNDSGIPPKRKFKEKVYKDGRKVNHQIWMDAQVRNMLKQICYIGKARNYEGNEIPSKAYPRILTDEIFYQVQSIKQVATYFKSAIKEYVGVLRCKTCNAPYNIKIDRRNNKVRYSYGHSRYGNPSGSFKKWKDCKEHSPSYIAEKKIDELLRRAWLWIFSFSSYQEKLFEEQLKVIKFEEDNLKEIKKKYGDEITQVDSKLDNIKKAIMSGAFDPTDFVEEVKNLKDQKSKMIKDIEKVEVEIGNAKKNFRHMKNQFSNKLFEKFYQNRREVLRQTVIFYFTSKTEIEIELISFPFTGYSLDVENPEIMMSNGSPISLWGDSMFDYFIEKMDECEGKDYTKIMEELHSIYLDRFSDDYSE